MWSFCLGHPLCSSLLFDHDLKDRRDRCFLFLFLCFESTTHASFLKLAATVSCLAKTCDAWRGFISGVWVLFSLNVLETNIFGKKIVSAQPRFFYFLLYYFHLISGNHVITTFITSKISRNPSKRSYKIILIQNVHVKIKKITVHFMRTLTFSYICVWYYHFFTSFTKNKH